MNELDRIVAKLPWYWRVYLRIRLPFDIAWIRFLHWARGTKGMDWLVCYYDNEDRLIYSFEILNRSESEAEKEAILELSGDMADWTLSPIRPKRQK